ncbi:MAG: AAA family ATPase, partial [Silvibacterium sp.]
TDKSSISSLSGFFCRLLDADGRLSAANPPDNISITEEALYHPIHYLQWNDLLERQLSEQFRKAFGAGIVVHRNAGKVVPVLVGDMPQTGPAYDRLSFEYISELTKLPPIQTQGDGMRSFLGILLFAMVGNQTILLIDEPEAFLHPPQARHLGEVLVSESKGSRQLFVATHSGDVLRGMLNANSSRVRVLRLRRSGGVNIVRSLSNVQVQQSWGDSLLRYSNILDGLFHEKVIVCESDSDCRFYAAILDSIFESSASHDRKPDIMFTHCGGKDRLPLAIRSLRGLDVPVSVVVDFDVLSSERPLRDIVDAVGGDWRLMEPDWRNIKNTIDGKKPELDTAEVRREIEGVLSKVTTGIFPDATKKRIQEILRRSSPWSNAKEVGVSFLPNGHPTQSCERLLSALESWGVFVVPVGQLEGFVKSVGRHGPAWVAEALTMDLSNNSVFGAAMDFVRKLVQ